MVGERIAKARVALDWSQQQLADRLGTTQPTIQRYESGERDLNSSKLVAMSAALGVTVSYLLGMDDDDQLPPTRYVDVPLYGSIAAGTPIEMVAVEDSHPIPERVRDAHPGCFLLRVCGESMNRVLPNGSYALVEPCEEVTRDGKPYAVCVNGYDATIKRVRRLANGFELVPDSTDPTFRPTVYDYGVEGTEVITVIGRVVWYCVPWDWEF